MNDVGSQFVTGCFAVVTDFQEKTHYRTLMLISNSLKKRRSMIQHAIQLDFSMISYSRMFFLCLGHTPHSHNQIYNTSRIHMPLKIFKIKSIDVQNP